MGFAKGEGKELSLRLRTPQREIAELCALAPRDHPDAALPILESLVMRLDHLIIDAGTPVVAADFDADVVPGGGIGLYLDFHEFLASRFFRNAAHFLDPDRVRSDDDPAEMVVRIVGVATNKTDLRRSAQLELTRQDEVAEIRDVFAHGLVPVRPFFARTFLDRISCTVDNLPFPYPAAPSGGSSLRREGLRTVEGLGRNERVRHAELGLWRSRLIGNREGEAKKGGEGKKRVFHQVVVRGLATQAIR